MSSRLLFAGTEFGLFVSLDGGDHWMPWRNGIPAVPVRAIMVHPRDHDLVIGTHGRAAFILVDIRPLRELSVTPALADSPLHLFPPPPAYQVEIAERIGYRSTGHAMFFGENRPQGALLSAWIGEDAAGSPATVRILDGDGEDVRTFQEAVEPGLNRFTWDLRMDAPSQGGGSYGPRGALVLPGRYTIRVEAAGSAAEASLTVLPDPRSDIPEARRLAKIQALQEAGEWLALSQEAAERLGDALEGVEVVLNRLEKEDTPDTALVDAGRTLRETLKAAQERLFTGPECQGICGGETVAGPIRQPLSLLGSSVDAPSPNDRLAMDRASEALDRVLSEVNEILSGPVAEFNRTLQEAGYTPLALKAPLTRIGRR